MNFMACTEIQMDEMKVWEHGGYIILNNDYQHLPRITYAGCTQEIHISIDHLGANETILKHKA